MVGFKCPPSTSFHELCHPPVSERPRPHLGSNLRVKHPPGGCCSQPTGRSKTASSQSGRRSKNPVLRSTGETERHRFKRFLLKFFKPKLCFQRNAQTLRNIFISSGLLTGTICCLLPYCRHLQIHVGSRGPRAPGSQSPAVNRLSRGSQEGWLLRAAGCHFIHHAP